MRFFYKLSSGLKIEITGDDYRNFLKVLDKCNLITYVENDDEFGYIIIIEKEIYNL